MTSLINRIKIIEKRLEESSTNQNPKRCLVIWRSGDKEYYWDDEGNEREYISGGHTGVGVIGFIYPKQMAMMLKNSISPPNN